MGVRKAGQAQREARVLAAAQELFLAKGYDRTSMREIAELAGVSVGTVANTGSKAALLGSLFSHNETSALLGRIASLETRGDLRPADEMEHVFGAWFDRVGQETELVRDALLSMLTGGGEGPAERRAQDGAVLHALSRRLLHHNPDLDALHAHGLALAVYSLYATMVLGILIEDLPVVEARHRARTGVRAVLDGLGPAAV